MTEPTPTLYAYHLLKAATAQYGRAPQALNPDEKDRAERIAVKSLEIESLVLGSDEASKISVDEGAVTKALNEMQASYEDPSGFMAALASQGLDIDSLKEAVSRELWATLVMERVGARAEPVTDEDIKTFFETNQDKFSVEETRTVRHILVTINDDYEDNTRDAAQLRIEEVLVRLNRGEDFGLVAKTSSECPTAVEQGILGRAPRGKLFPELDAALFDLDEGALAGPIETEMGFHIIRCDKIHAPEKADLEQARPSIFNYLTQKNAQQAQRLWLASLT